jgi:hypothetical protein
VFVGCVRVRVRARARARARVCVWLFALIRGRGGIVGMPLPDSTAKPAPSSPAHFYTHSHPPQTIPTPSQAAPATAGSRSPRRTTGEPFGLLVVIYLLLLLFLSFPLSLVGHISHALAQPGPPRRTRSHQNQCPCIHTSTSIHTSVLTGLKFDDSRVENASVEFDEEKLAPTYKLLWGVPGACVCRDSCVWRHLTAW